MSTASTAASQAKKESPAPQNGTGKKRETKEKEKEESKNPPPASTARYVTSTNGQQSNSGGNQMSQAPSSTSRQPEHRERGGDFRSDALRQPASGSQRSAMRNEPYHQTHRRSQSPANAGVKRPRDRSPGQFVRSNASNLMQGDHMHPRQKYNDDHDKKNGGQPKKQGGGRYA